MSLVLKPPRTPVADAPAPRLPLSVEFQGMLLKILLGDAEFSGAISDHIAPHFFANQVHAWAWSQALAYRRAYWGWPTLNYLTSLAQQQSPEVRDVYVATMAVVRDVVVTDEAALRDSVLNFVRRNVFRQAFIDSRDLFNVGKEGPAYDLMQERMSVVSTLTWEPVRRSWFAEGFADRHIRRQDPSSNPAFSTGIPALDLLMGGGIHTGEVGTWMGPPKAGKSIWLVNLGHVAVRYHLTPTLHLIYEGGLKYIENRYDARFADENYMALKQGDIDPQKYAYAMQELQNLRRLLVLRDLSPGQIKNTNIAHVMAEVSELRRVHKFSPKLIIHDYVDKMRSATLGADAPEREIQKQAMQDLKDFAGRGDGVAIWTACQVQRPKGEDWADVQDVLMSNKIADSFDKVRIADFIGSLNQTRQEREQGVMRLYAELYRDGPCHQTIQIGVDFTKMAFFPLAHQPAPPGPNGAVQRAKPLGYGSTINLQQRTNKV